MAKKSDIQPPVFTDMYNTPKGQTPTQNVKAISVVKSNEPDPVIKDGTTNVSYNNLKSNPIIIQKRGPGVSGPANLGKGKK